MQTQKIINYRYESFGGILHLRYPSALVFVDKDYMVSLGYDPSPLWDSRVPILSAPTEVHLAVTNHCSKNCSYCYMDSKDCSGNIHQGVVDGELGPEGLRRAVDAMAEMRVFHVALGGGESFEMPWLMDLVGYVRSKGMVPNITTNGHFISERNLFQCKNFGQINLSLNEVGPDFSSKDTKDHFEKADATLSLLRKSRTQAGINCLVTRQNYDKLEDVIRYAKKMKLREVELLRFKPSGRAAASYFDSELTTKQAAEFFPYVVALMKRHRVTLKLDCSFTPMICAHNPDPEKMDYFAVLGCDGGNMLMGGRADGRVAPCSFAPWEDLRIHDLSRFWNKEDTFEIYRNWNMTAPEPCRSCNYLKICRGGCHAITQFVSGNPALPDPGCPIVRDYLPVLN